MLEAKSGFSAADNPERLPARSCMFRPGAPQSASHASSFLVAASSEIRSSSAAISSRPPHACSRPSVSIPSPSIAGNSDADVVGTAKAVPRYPTLSDPCASQVRAAFAAIKNGSDPSTRFNPLEADDMKESRISNTRLAASSVSRASPCPPGTNSPTIPAPVIVNPASPKLSAHASRTVAAV
ncbi:Uncharacterised protein [Collinsella intestinalis]|nr:Uncharacterised protein [Collinsella intestinalis]